MVSLRRIRNDNDNLQSRNDARAEQRDEPPKAAEPKSDAEIAAAAIAFCQAHQLVAIPQVYEVAYTHCQGSNAPLSARMTSAAARGSVTQYLIMQIYQEHLGPDRLAQGLEKIGIGLNQEVVQVSAVLDENIHCGKAVSEELSSLCSSIVRAPSRDTVSRQAGRIREIGMQQVSANARLRASLQVTQNRLLVLEKEIARQTEAANTDHLTGLPNRRALDARIARVFANPATAARECLIMVDIDNFKQINDAFGHEVGDTILKRVAEVLRNTVGSQGFVARWGGEEFAIVINSLGYKQSLELAERMRRTLESFCWTRRRDGAQIGTVTASFGVSERGEKDSAEAFCRRADAALYRAKQAGRNQTAFVGPELAA